MDIDKSRITNPSNYLKVRYGIGLQLFLSILYGLSFINGIPGHHEIDNSNDQLGLYLIFCVLIITLIVNYYFFRGVTYLYKSDYGIHSRRLDISWQTITGLSCKRWLGIQILFIEYITENKTKSLKTALPSDNKEMERSFNKIWLLWNSKKNA